MAADPDAPDKIDTKNLPKGATPVMGGTIIAYKGAFYSPYDGRLLSKDSVKDAIKANDDLKDEVTEKSPLELLGDLAATLGSGDLWTRAGLILLGAVLAIVGLTMFVSGTKAAQLATSLIPAGKVLK